MEMEIIWAKCIYHLEIFLFNTKYFYFSKKRSIKRIYDAVEAVVSLSNLSYFIKKINGLKPFPLLAQLFLDQ